MFVSYLNEQFFLYIPDQSLNTFLAEIKELVLFFNNQIASSILLENQTKLKKQLDAWNGFRKVGGPV